MGDFLLFSLIASVVLTVILNLALRFGPSRKEPLEQPEQAWLDQPEDGRGNSKVRVFFPWKAMLAVSIGLTVLVNLGAYLMR